MQLEVRAGVMAEIEEYLATPTTARASAVTNNALAGRVPEADEGIAAVARWLRPRLGFDG